MGKYRRLKTPEEFEGYNYRSFEDILRFMVDMREYVRGHETLSEHFEQQLHSDAPAVGNKKKPAVNDASYVDFGRNLLSISWPEFVKMCEFEDPENGVIQGFSMMNSSAMFAGLLNVYGIDYETTKTGRDGWLGNVYLEVDGISDQDFEKGRALIDAFTRSKKTDFRALHKEIKRALQKDGFYVPAKYPEEIDYRARGSEYAPIEAHLKFLIDAREYIRTQPAPDGFKQYAHSGDPPIGNPRTPALVNASYEHYKKFRVSMAWPDFIPMQEDAVRTGASLSFSGLEWKTGFHAHNVAASLYKTMNIFGISLTDDKVGFHSEGGTVYFEARLINKDDFEIGQAIIDTIVRSETTDPVALRAEIEERIGYSASPPKSRWNLGGLFGNSGGQNSPRRDKGNDNTPDLG